MQMEAEVESTFLTQKLQSFKVNEFVFLVLEKKIETLLNYYCRCPSLSCPLDSLPPGGQANRGWLAPRGASCPGISCPPPWLSSPPGRKLSRPVYLAPRLTQVKIYTCYFVIFLYHYNEFRSSISHKVRNWCLWG